MAAGPERYEVLMASRLWTVSRSRQSILVSLSDIEQRNAFSTS